MLEPNLLERGEGVPEGQPPPAGGELERPGCPRADSRVRWWDKRDTMEPMARGWESKGVESQQDDARRSRGPLQPALSAADRAHHDRRRTLELALAETQAQLGAACRPVHRDMLQQKLEAIRAALEE
jgi:hypothetical protein